MRHGLFFGSCQDAESQFSVWKTICHHIDGIAIGSTVHALALNHVFDILNNSDTPLNVNSLASQAGSKPGFFHVALRLLAHQGFLRLSGQMENDLKEISFTESGKAWLAFVNYYNQFPALFAVSSLLRRRFSAKEFRPHSEPVTPKVPDYLNSSFINHRVMLHLYGPLVATIMTELYLNGTFEKIISNEENFLPFDEIHPERTISKFVARVLSTHGWAQSGSANGSPFPKPLLFFLMGTLSAL